MGLTDGEFLVRGEACTLRWHQIVVDSGQTKWFLILAIKGSCYLKEWYQDDELLSVW